MKSHEEISHFIRGYLVVAAVEIRDHETGLVSGPFSWFQSYQIFLETHETETNPIFWIFVMPK